MKWPFKKSKKVYKTSFLRKFSMDGGAHVTETAPGEFHVHMYSHIGMTFDFDFRSELYDFAVNGEPK